VNILALRWSNASRTIVAGCVILALVVVFPGQSDAQPPLALSVTHEDRAVAAGTDLSPEEASQARGVTEAVHELDEQARRTYPETYAGLWRNLSQGGRVQVAFTSDAEQNVQRLRRNFPRPELLDAVQVDFSLIELERLAERIVDAWSAWERRGIHLTRIAVSPERNRVEVGVEPSSATHASAIEEDYGPAVLLEAVPAVDLVCARENCISAPLRAGLWLDFAPRLNSCTAAFTATRGGREGILSAGHCGNLDNTVLHGGLIVGAVAYLKFSDNQDSMWIQKSSTYLQPIRRWVWQLPDQTTYPITSRMGASGGTAGDPICHSGARRGYRCGRITNPSVTVRINDGSLFGVRLTDMVEDDICTGPGDSGGPTYHSNRAHGIIAASNAVIGSDNYTYRCVDSPRTYYSKIANVESALGVRVKTD
jgi:streptogrisin C